MAQTQSLPPPFAPSPYGAAPQYDHKASNVGPLQPNGQALQMPRNTQATSPHVFSGTRDHWQFSLHVEQQPVRARMCGFGDKDRRPITPPPCVRLVILDTRTHKEVPADQVDASFFVLQVDLWDESGAHETNVVRAASNSPATSISTATTTSYPPPPDRQPVYAAPPPLHARDPYSGAFYPPQHPSHYPTHPMYSQSAPVPSMYPQPPAPPGYYAQPMTPYSPYPGPPNLPAPLAYQPQYHAVMQPQPPQSGMFTRNLIGSLSVNAFQLRDPKGKEGHWFVLQDLSVRTEGNFRLKMNFIDVGSNIDGRNTLNQGKCPVLASAFSQPFQVFSAKKFPGVIESTELSKTFAGQGIKIPIRKDGGKNESKDEDDD